MSGRSRAPVRPGPVTHTYAASHMQGSLWRAARDERSSAVVSVTVAITGPLDVDRLRRSVAALMLRHESLRTHLGRHPDGWHAEQRVSADAGERMRVDDIAASRTLRAAMEAEVERKAAAAPMRLDGPLVRWFLVGTDPERHLLFLACSHAICDGWSLGVILDELSALYAGEELSAAPQYGPWAERERTPPPAERARYWRERLAGHSRAVPGLDPPGPRRRTLVEPFSIPAQTVAQLETVTRSVRAPLPAALLVALTAALTGGPHGDLTIGLMVAGREEPSTDRIVGMLADVMPCRVQWHQDPTIRDALAVAGRRLADDLDARVPLGALGACLDRSPGQSGPIFGASLNIAPRRAPDVRERGGVHWRVVADHPMPEEPAHRWWAAEAPVEARLSIQHDGSLAGAMAYDATAAEARWRAAVTRRFTAALDRIARDPSRSMSQIGASS